MPFDFETIRHRHFEPRCQELATREATLSPLAIGNGNGNDPRDRRERRLVDEDGLFATPTLATPLALPRLPDGLPRRNPDLARSARLERRALHDRCRFGSAFHLPGEVRFRARVLERDDLVPDDGVATLGSPR